MLGHHRLPTNRRHSFGGVVTPLTRLTGSIEDMRNYLAEIQDGELGIVGYLDNDTLYWGGGQARAEGLEGAATGDEFEGMLIGRPLDDLGNEDAELVVSENRKLLGLDVEFTMPKSLSVFVAALDPEQQLILFRAHEMAVDAAIAHLDKIAGTRRGKDGMGEWQSASGILTVKALHFTSREDDPHGHTHVEVANRVLTRDGKTLTLDTAMLYDQVPLAASIYGHELRRVTEWLGLKWTGPHPGKDGRLAHFEVEGVPQVLADEFSTRNKQITKKLAENPGMPPDWAARITRKRKGPPEPLIDKAERWKDRIAELARDFSLATLRWRPTHRVAVAKLNQPLPIPPAPLPPAAERAEVIKSAVDKLTESFATWDITDVITRIIESCPSYWTQETIESVANELIRRQDLVCVLGTRAAGGLDCIRPGGQRMATWEVLDAEDTVSDFFSADQGLREDLDESLLQAEHAIARAAARDGQPLDDSQAAAVRAIASCSRSHVLIGPAGTGKTTVFATVSEWAQRTGIDRSRIVGMAVSQTASELIGDAMGCLRMNQVNTTRGLMADKVPYDGLLVLDEASMCNSRQMSEIVTTAAERNTKVVVVGDPGQLGAVAGPGGLLASLDADPDTAVSRLEIPWRFENEWEQQVTLRLGDQRATVRETARDTYVSHGRISGLTPDVPEMESDKRYLVFYERVADRVVPDIKAGKQVIVSTSSNAEADMINYHIQQKLFPDRPTTSIRINGRATPIGVGDRVVTRTNSWSLRTTTNRPVLNSTAWTVDSISDGELKLTGVDPKMGSVIIGPEYLGNAEPEIDGQSHRRSLQLGWASTAHVSQGKTCDIGFAVVSAATTAEALLVMGTRGRTANHFLTVGDQDDAVETFDAAVQRARAPMAATQVEHELLQRPARRQQREEHPTTRPVRESPRGERPRGPPPRASPGSPNPAQTRSNQSQDAREGQPPAAKKTEDERYQEELTKFIGSAIKKWPKLTDENFAEAFAILDGERITSRQDAQRVWDELDRIQRPQIEPPEIDIGF